MKIITTNIRGKEFKLAVASNKKEHTKGLSNTKNLKKEAGMLFVFDKPQDVDFNTTEMNYPLDILFLDENWDVLEYIHAQPGKSTLPGTGVKYVIETNAGQLPVVQGTNLKIDGDGLKYVEKHNEKIKEEEEKEDKEEPVEEVEPVEERDMNVIVARKEDKEEHQIFRTGGKVIKAIQDQIEAKKGQMQVLDDEGKILMNIEGGERIFSRIHTKEIVSMAEDVKSGNISAEEFGEAIKGYINKQDTQEAEYVYE